MRNITSLLLACLLLVGLHSMASAQPATSLPDFTLHRLGTGNPALLVVGGIQGDEPGGFSAASLLVTHYRITSGSVWVVPNLNFPCTPRERWTMLGKFRLGTTHTLPEVMR